METIENYKINYDISENLSPNQRMRRNIDKLIEEKKKFTLDNIEEELGRELSWYEKGAYRSILQWEKKVDVTYCYDINNQVITEYIVKSKDIGISEHSIELT